MTINDVSNVFGFLGGLGMFLYGMNIMADGMQKTAGSKMSQFLSMLTNNRLMAVCLGALITAIIQSSGATTVMVVGFVSAGVLNLTQAVGVIMGANIDRILKPAGKRHGSDETGVLCAASDRYWCDHDPVFQKREVPYHR